MKKIRVEEVKTLNTEGKSYNLYYKGKLTLNFTLESGNRLNKRLAMAILQDMLKKHDINTVVKPSEVTFEEAEPDFD